MEGAHYAVTALPTANMHFTAAFLFGAWYSMVLAGSMSAGVRFLHPETPDSHEIVALFAYALGSGGAIALATHFSKTYRLAVGICVTFASQA